MEFHNISNMNPHTPVHSADMRTAQPVQPVTPVARSQEGQLPLRQGSSAPAQLPAMKMGELEIRVDEDTDRLVVSIFDAQGALLRQIPAEVVLQLARRLEQVMSTRSLGLRAEA
ncbi:MAG: flagellar protein FlaG [Oceanococcaceae bacterium]